MKDNRLGYDARAAVVESSTILRKKTPKNVTISATTSNVSNTSTRAISGVMTTEREDSMSVTTPEASTISSDNIGFVLDQDRQGREGAPSEELVEETCFECSVKFLLSLDDAMATELALCAACKYRQIEIEDSITKNGRKMRASPIARQTKKSSSSKKIAGEKGGVMDVNNRDDDLKNTMYSSENSGDSIYMITDGHTTQERPHQNIHFSSSSLASSHASKPKTQNEIVEKMRENNLTYLFCGRHVDEDHTRVVDAMKSCKSRPERKQRKPKSLKEILGGDTMYDVAGAHECKQISHG